MFHSNLSNKSEKAVGNFGGGAKKCGGENHQFLKVRGTCVPPPPPSVEWAVSGLVALQKLNLAYNKLTNIFNQIKSNHFYCHITTAHVPW